jgi:hypothetical protein
MNRAKTARESHIQMGKLNTPSPLATPFVRFPAIEAAFSVRARVWEYLREDSKENFFGSLFYNPCA